MRKKIRHKFAHLHLHTEHSLLDSIIQISKLGDYLKKKNLWACAITDHGTLTGVYRFVSEMAKHRIKPIVGCEFYWAENHSSRTGERYHVTVLAKNVAGWLKILKIHERAYVEGFYRVPRIDQELLNILAGDCIVLSGCVSGPGNQDLLIEDKTDWFQRTHNVFGDDFYLEIQPNEQNDQILLNQKLVDLGRKENIELVATNDCHYFSNTDWEVHDTLLAMRQSYHGKTVLVSDPDRWRYSSRQFYIKDRKEMERSFERLHPNLSKEAWTRALDNTVVIANKIDAKVLRRRKKILPNVDLGDHNDPESLLETLVWNGWNERKIDEKTFGRVGVIDWLEDEDEIELPLVEVYEQRVKWELNQICDMGFAQYILLVWDMIAWARSNGIRVGPGRGSVSGSLVAYLIGITAVDSIKYNCPFARFIAPARVDLPDIDVDFPSSTRDRVQRYLKDIYGADCVAGISNYDAMKARGALRDVARVWGILPSEINKVTKEIVGDTLISALDKTPALVKFKERYPDVFRIASSLEGQIRSIGAHAAGIVVSDEPLTNLCPMRVKDGENICEWDKRDLERVGLVKLDVLGIDALDYISDTIDIIKETRGEIIEPEDFDLLDKGVYEAFQKGNNELTWQFNSNVAIQTLKQLKPDRFDHLVAASALLRPGPLRSGITDQYLQRRHGCKTDGLDDRLDDLLQDTYGLAIYQEDVMILVRKLAGFTWSEADGLRKAVGKKLPEELEKYHRKFVDGSITGGMNESIAEKIWGQLQEFAAYAFNRAHSTAYGMLSYWTQYFKIKYPIEFLSSVLKTQRDWSKRVGYIREARRLGANVLPPDVQKSSEKTKPDVEENIIRLGLGDVKGIRAKDAESIVLSQPYNDIWDYFHRSGSSINTTKLLISIGALDSLTDSPKWILENLHLAKSSRNMKEDIPQEPICFSEHERIQSLLSLVGYPPESDTYEPLISSFEDKCGFKLSTISEAKKYSKGWYGLICCCVTKVGRAKTGRLKVEVEDTDDRSMVIAETQKIVPEGEPNVGGIYLSMVSPLDEIFVSSRMWKIDTIDKQIDKTIGIRKFLGFDSNISIALSDLSSNVKNPIVLIVTFDRVKLKSGSEMGVAVVGGSKGKLREIQIWGNDLEYYSKFWKDGLILRCPIYNRKNRKGWAFSSRQASMLKILG